jgi:hypothetical protein
MSELPKTKPIVKNRTGNLLVVISSCVVVSCAFRAEAATNSAASDNVYMMHESMKYYDSGARGAGNALAFGTNSPIQYEHHEGSTLHFIDANKPHSIAPHATGIAHATGSHFWDPEKKWWNGGSALMNWFGLGFPLKDRGLTVTGEFKQVYYGFVAGGMPNQPNSEWLTEVKLRAIVDFERIFGETARGFSFVSNWRYRNRGDNPQFKMGVPVSQLSESANSGTGVRVMTQYLQWQSDNSKDPSVIVNAGWENPYEYFLQQPLSKIFELNSVNASKGIGATLGNGIPVVSNDGKNVQYYRTSGVPWTSSYATWGGTLKVKPSYTTYIQCGLYMAISGGSGVNPSIYGTTDVYPYTSVSRQYLGTYKSTGQVLKTVGTNGQLNGKTTTQGFVPTASNNHGFTFQGAPKFQPNTQNIGVPGADIGMGGLYQSNGIYTVNEVGWTPKFGQDKLEGKYVFGGYIWGQPNTDFMPVQYSAYATKKAGSYLINQLQWGLYWQADQRLYAVKEDVKEGDGPTVRKVTKRGLYSFNVASYTPPQNNILPFYAHTGLVYRGLLPQRDEDMIGCVYAIGVYSSYFNDWLKSQNQSLVNSYTSSQNATVPNGPTTASAKQLGAGSSTTQNTYWAYRPMLSTTQELEGFYSLQLNKWATIKPYAQYIINPAGNGQLGNEWILGARFLATF